MSSFVGKIYFNKRNIFPCLRTDYEKGLTSAFYGFGVTRMGERPMGEIVFFKQFLKNYRSMPHIWAAIFN
jgi:hypothetical protein